MSVRNTVLGLVVFGMLASAAGCSVDPRADADADAEAGTSASELRALSAAEILGTLHYGETSAPVPYTAQPLYRAFLFQGQAGDAVDIAVNRTSASGADAYVWLLDAHFATVRASKAPTLTLSLATSGTFYVAFREPSRRAATYTVTLSAATGCDVDYGATGGRACAETAPFCRNHACVPCGAQAACPSSRSVCLTSGTRAGACLACDGDFGAGSIAACPSAGAAFCMASGAQSGQCVGCSGHRGWSAAPSCDAAKPLCDRGTCRAKNGTDFDPPASLKNRDIEVPLTCTLSNTTSPISVPLVLHVSDVPYETPPFTRSGSRVPSKIELVSVDGYVPDEIENGSASGVAADEFFRDFNRIAHGYGETWGTIYAYARDMSASEYQLYTLWGSPQTVAHTLDVKVLPSGKLSVSMQYMDSSCTGTSP